MMKVWGQLWEEDKSVEMISFLTGLSWKVVQEHFDIFRKLQRELKREAYNHHACLSDQGPKTKTTQSPLTTV